MMFAQVRESFIDEHVHHVEPAAQRDEELANIQSQQAWVENVEHLIQAEPSGGPKPESPPDIGLSDKVILLRFGNPPAGGIDAWPQFHDAMCMELISVTRACLQS
jgi:hypothetical protein